MELQAEIRHSMSRRSPGTATPHSSFPRKQPDPPCRAISQPELAGQIAAYVADEESAQGGVTGGDPQLRRRRRRRAHAGTPAAGSQAGATVRGVGRTRENVPGVWPACRTCRGRRCPPGCQPNSRRASPPTAATNSICLSAARDGGAGCAGRPARAESCSGAGGGGGIQPRALPRSSPN